MVQEVTRKFMAQETVFAEILEEVRKKARAQQNFITKTEVEEAFSALSLSAEQMEMVYDYLRQNKIGVDEPVDADACLEEEEKNYLDDYLETLRAIPKATDGEREAITLSAMAGDADAIKRLTELMLPEVPQIARLYTGQGVSLEDLIGEGNVALSLGVTMLGALEHADEAQGMLAKMMMDAMEDCIAASAAEEKSDRKIADKVNKVADAANALKEELRRAVTVEELMEESGLSRKAIEDAVRISGGKIESIAAE
jgi:RNA polymerase primary sigma factor